MEENLNVQVDEKEMNEYINTCEMLVDDTVAELYNIEDTHKADLKLLTIGFFRRVKEELKLDITIN